MILTNDRTELDKALENDDFTLLLLSGTVDSRASIVHACMEEDGWEDWYRCFLITSFDLLTVDEVNEWFNRPDPEKYAVLGGDSPKQVATRGDVDYLLLPDTDECDSVNIMEELAKGDVL